MKRIFTFGVLALCLATAQIARAAENNNAQIKSQIVENYLLWQEAWKNRDAERIISFESPDFTAVAKDGKTDSKAKNDENLRELVSMIGKVHQARIELKKLSIEPNRVVVWAKQHLDADVSLDQKQSNRIAITLYTKDIWVQYDGIWMLKRMEELSSKFIVDGKPQP